MAADLISGPLNDAQLSKLNQALGELQPNQLIWVSGYLAGLAQSGSAAPSAPVASNTQALTILYGSQSGNAKKVATELAKQAEAKGLPVKLSNMGSYKPKQLKDESHLMLVVSTYGEGDPPDEAAALHSFLASKRAPKLDKLQFAVLGLGDSSYEFFCQTGIEFDQRLEKLGATRLLPRVDCDVEFSAAAQQWQSDVLALIPETFTESAASNATAQQPTAAAEQRYTKAEPYAAELILSQKITGRDSDKDIRHVELDLGDSGIHYQPGDALGVWFDNDPQLVAELLTLLQIEAETQVTLDGKELSIKQALLSHLEITQTTPGFVSAYAELAEDENLNALLEDKAKLRHFSAERQLIDIISAYPVTLSAEFLASQLRPLSPRLYSIASSQEEVGEEVHLTVGTVRYDAFDRSHSGAASSFLADRVQEGDAVRVFVEPNEHFKLPANPDTPVIMIGPGTGIAPFRAFMQQREAEGATGKNWLFFGNPHLTQDFLYQVEWQSYVASGLLSHIDLAFSRDQAEKIYVQDRIRQQAEQLYQWLQQGAYLYVCGDASKMAKDVHQALIEVVSQQGNLDAEAAEAYLNNLRSEKRYQRDVY